MTAAVAAVADETLRAHATRAWERIGRPADVDCIVTASEAEALIAETETIFNRFGMGGPVFPTDINRARELRKHAKRFGIDLLLIRQKHIGSDRLPARIAAIADHLRAKGVTLRTSEEVNEVLVKNGRAVGVAAGRNTYSAGHVGLAPGRVGAVWMGAIAQKFALAVDSS